jgi:hypothetical protein
VEDAGGLCEREGSLRNLANALLTHMPSVAQDMSQVTKNNALKNRLELAKTATTSRCWSRRLSEAGDMTLCPSAG